MSVPRSPHGNSTCNHAAIVDKFSLSYGNPDQDGSYIPRALGALISARPCSLCFLSSANWLSNAAILRCVKLGCWAWVPWIGIGSCEACWGVRLRGFWLFEVSLRTTRSTISCSCNRSSSRIVLKLIGISEGEPDNVGLSTLLGDIGVAGCGEIVLERSECDICIHSLLGEDWLYWDGGCSARVPHYW